jgi:aspartate racemase
VLIKEIQMKTIGLLGGMSWESAASYYQLINQGMNEKLGGLHSAKLCLYSLDFQEIEELQRQNNWEESARLLCEAAKSVELAGADFLLLCTNTMHKVATEIENALSIPLLHIADATAETLIENGVKTVGLLGTRFTMEQEFYKDRMTKRYGIEVIVPNSNQRTMIHEIIYSELCHGKILDDSRQKFVRVIRDLHEAGAQAVILGCTEIGLLVNQADIDVPLYDTTAIHAKAAVVKAIS